MSVLGNILWVFICGIWIALSWYIAGFILCITIIGIPLGVQCFKIGTFALLPFGRQIVYSKSGFGSLLGNIIWLLFFGWEIALVDFITGCILCITIIGIPFGKQCFKLAQLALMPFGAAGT
ncbi:MAG: YccF domain-containing protein [Eubacteriales bacterium]